MSLVIRRIELCSPAIAGFGLSCAAPVLQRLSLVEVKVGVAGLLAHRDLLPNASGGLSLGVRRSALDAGVRQRLVEVVAVAVAEADAAAAPEHQLLALQMDLRLAFDGDVRAVRALVDDHELVAAALD